VQNISANSVERSNAKVIPSVILFRAVMNLHDIFEIDIDFSQFEKYASDDYGDDKEMDTEEGCNEEVRICIYLCQVSERISRKYFLTFQVEEGFGISNTKIKPKKKWKKKKKKRSIYDMM